MKSKFYGLTWWPHKSVNLTNKVVIMGCAKLAVNKVHRQEITRGTNDSRPLTIIGIMAGPLVIKIIRTTIYTTLIAYEKFSLGDLSTINKVVHRIL